jgi:hypothetical protein
MNTNAQRIAHALHEAVRACLSEGTFGGDASDGNDFGPAWSRHDASYRLAMTGLVTSVMDGRIRPEEVAALFGPATPIALAILKAVAAPQPAP